MKNMKKIISVLILSLVVVSGLVFANRGTKNEIKPSVKPLSIAEQKAYMAEQRKKWQASADGIAYMKWEASAEGKKVNASYDNIKKHIREFSDMQAVVSSVTFKRDGKSSAIKWLIVRIDGEEYMMQFPPKDFEKLKNLKVNDKITVKSRSAANSPNHPYLILSGDYIAQDNKVLFKRDFSKNKGC